MEQKTITTTVFLTPVDAELFINFQKNYSLFKFLVDKGVFEQKNACILLDFDPNGQISSIRRQDFLFSARH